MENSKVLMEAGGLKLSVGLSPEKIGRRKEAVSVGFGERLSVRWKCRKASFRQRKLTLEPLHACQDFTAPVSVLQSPSNSLDGNRLIQRKGQEVASYLNGRCIFLVGMMGSGKTTVGRILSEALGYTFVDSDKYIEEAVGTSSVSRIFEKNGENFFRDVESQALRKLSLKPQQVVATGGGSVIRSSNWDYMKQGISVFIKVPVDALAKRIAAEGLESRPLLHFSSGDPYTQAFVGLFTLYKKRTEAYSLADTTVSISDVAEDMGLEDFSDLTPKDIAMAVLVQLDKYVKDNNAESCPPFS